LTEEFKKYGDRGAYHWDAFKRSVKRHNPYLAGRYRIVESMLEDAGLSGGRALDIGCGDGAISFLLAKGGWAVFGLDYSGTGLGLAREKFRERGKSAAFMRGDSCSLPIKDGAVDAVVAADIIEHLHEQERFLTEVVRVLRPGGAAVITTPVKLSDVPEDEEHVREYTEDEFREALERHFESVRILKTHPRECFDNYSRTVRLFGFIGRVRPYRYLYNFMSSYLDKNPFMSCGGVSTQLSAIAQKRK
jgi:ubiquinone/menaquinone biosynthesis C-methylase UbiE